MFKGLLRVIAGVAGSFLYPIIGALSGIVAVSERCSNTEAAILFNFVLVALALISAFLAATLVFSWLSYIIFAAIFTVVKKTIVSSILSTPLCNE